MWREQEVKCIPYLVHSSPMNIFRKACESRILNMISLMQLSMETGKSYQVLRMVSFINPGRVLTKYYFFFQQTIEEDRKITRF